MWSTDSLLFLEVAKEGQSLDGLTETHFVGQDAIYSGLIERDDPIEAGQLVVLKFAAFK